MDVVGCVCVFFYTQRQFPDVDAYCMRLCGGYSVRPCPGRCARIAYGAGCKFQGGMVQSSMIRRVS